MTRRKPQGYASFAQTLSPPTRSPRKLRIPSNAGWNRFVWDLRYPDAHKVIPHNDNQQGLIKGPHAAPGTYWVTLCFGEEELSTVV